MGRLGLSGWTRGFLSRMEGEQSPRKQLVGKHGTEMVQRPSGRGLGQNHRKQLRRTCLRGTCWRGHHPASGPWELLRHRPWWNGTQCEPSSCSTNRNLRRLGARLLRLYGRLRHYPRPPPYITSENESLRV